MVENKNTKCLLDKVSKNILHEIKSYIPFLSFLNIFKYNKSYQNYLDIKFPIYKKLFLKNTIKINFDNVDNEKLISFLNKEFHNFTKENDKQLLNEIINEYKKEKQQQLFGKGELITPCDFCEVDYEPDMDWKQDKTDECLDLGFRYICHHHHSSFNIEDESEQKIIPSEFYPKVSFLFTDNNFIIPASMMKKLEFLGIIQSSRKKLLFYNDLNEEEIDLNNLKYLNICKNNIYTGPMSTEPKNKIVNYKIKFHFKKLETVIMHTHLERDYYFLKNYFGFDILDSVENIKNNEAKLYEHIKNKLLNYKFLETINYFDFYVHNEISCIEDINLNFKIQKYINNPKKYRYRFAIYERYGSLCREEIYEENENHEKYLVSYKNNGKLNEKDNFTCIDTINDFRLAYLKNDKYKEKINELFNIKKNNYSVQILHLDLNGNFDLNKLVKNISKFRVLKEIKIYDRIKDKNILFSIIKELKNLFILEVIILFFDGKLSSEDEKEIKNYFDTFSFKAISKTDEIRTKSRENNYIIFEINEDFKDTSLYYSFEYSF